MKFLSLFALLILIGGCGIFSAPGPSSKSYGVRDSWLGGSINDFKSLMGSPASQDQLSDGSQNFSWRKETTVTGPPRHDFGPGGRIKLRPGAVNYYYCNTFAVADSEGRISSLEFQGHCPVFLLPPARR